MATNNVNTSTPREVPTGLRPRSEAAEKLIRQWANDVDPRTLVD